MTTTDPRPHDDRRQAATPWDPNRSDQLALLFAAAHFERGHAARQLEAADAELARLRKAARDG